ncbi:DUF418 domain-containing protein [Rhodococcus triatomae]|uniref:Uncharacterized membrane protein YeiB n=1 Tax=Rhodococcus triatomae TaxID=300028 RepID=A0A1G8FC22_9NOCA|nr:DUF418 domain-containing protein [Rhodococcus triatomae]QNG19445.1 DUF418 domain-containing protein [Rhodococcus triatomae]QNG24641.1 DUF418 domain-containing protein [Rhodococcus triatomae]SDH79698.1 Uncharacterized membrane protein YeiB [Rhodococcus triatomae]
MTTSLPASVTSEASERGPRVIGVDIARALAVLGMIAVHTATAQQIGDTAFFLLSGRSAILFALLAGVSLALTTGEDAPLRGGPLRAARRSIAARALVLLVVGMALVELGSPVMVILATYAVLFWLVLPVLRWSWQRLAVAAAVGAVAGPALSWWIRSAGEPAETFGETPRFDLFTSGEGIRHLGSVLFVDGAYPVLTWLPFVLAGLAIGRWGVRRDRAPRTLIVVGSALAVAGYGGSWLALHGFGGYDVLVSHLEVIVPGEGAQMLDELLRSSGFGTFGVDPWQWILTASPHSGTPFEVVGSGGVAIAVLGVCLASVTTRAARAGWLSPLVALGAMPLTVYVGHVVALAVLIRWELFAPSWPMALGFLVVPVVFAVLWRRVARRGPLEWLLRRVGIVAARGRLPRASTKGGETASIGQEDSRR